MKKTTLKKIINIIFSLILGGLLTYGGISKLSQTMPKPKTVVEKAQKFQKSEQQQTLHKILFINGMKQTDYFWQFLGIMELVCGLLLLSQVFTVFGAIMAFPIIINIFLFHIFLEFDEIDEVLQATFLLFMNIWLIASACKKLKSIIYQPEKLPFLTFKSNSK